MGEIEKNVGTIRNILQKKWDNGEETTMTRGGKQE